MFYEIPVHQTLRGAATLSPGLTLGLGRRIKQVSELE